MAPAAALVVIAGSSKLRAWRRRARGSRQQRRPCAGQKASGSTSTTKAPEEEEKSIEERFEDFTRVLPWFDFAANLMEEHAQRRADVRKEGLADLPKPLQAVLEGNAGLSPLILDAADGRSEAPAFAQIAETALRSVEEGLQEPPSPAAIPDALRGRWEAVWSGAFSPLASRGLPRQCMWVEVSGGEKGEPAVLTCHSGVPLLFGAYLWTSCAGNMEEAEGSEKSKPLLLRFNRYWIDLGAEPRSDIGRVDGGVVETRLAAFGAALVTPVLLEFGVLKWLLERFGFERVFEVEVPSPEGKEGETVKLEASLELYLTLLAMVAFPPSLSTCPVPYLDTESGVCVYEIPLLGPIADLPDWLHPGGNAAVLIARKLQDGETPGQLRD